MVQPYSVNFIADLYQDILQKGCLQIRVTGRSMTPFIRTGESVTLMKVSGNALQKGDVILYRNPEGRLIMHRVIKTTHGENRSRIYQTMGDNAAAPDAPIHESRILGKAIEIQKQTLFFGFRQIRMNALFWKTVSFFLALKGLCKLSLPYRMLRRGRRFLLFK